MQLGENVLIFLGSHGGKLKCQLKYFCFCSICISKKIRLLKFGMSFCFRISVLFVFRFVAVAVANREL